MSAIILLTIGPVQSYISQARRTQDLWQGSRILSYLASAGVRDAMKQPQATVIYPSIEEHQTDNIPNRIVVRWLGDENGARICARGMQNAIEEAWRDVSQNTRDYFLKGVVGGEDAEAIWLRQQESWLECYWVVVPYDENKHAESINIANLAMGARKLLRNFPHIEEHGRKCSITGEHEALHIGGDYVDFWNARKAKENNLALLGKHERLSAISTIKRFAHEEVRCKDDNGDDTWCPINWDLRIDYRFPSTSSIAAAPFKYDVLVALQDRNQNTDELLGTLKEFIATLLNCYDEDNTIPIKGNRHPVRDLFFTKHGYFNPEYFPKIEAITGLTRKQVPASADEDLWATQFMCIDGDYLFEDTLIPKTIAEYMPVIDAVDNALKDFEKKRTAQLKPKVAEALKALKRLVKAASELGIPIPKPQPYLVILSMDGDYMGKTLGKLRDAGQHKIFSETLANFARKGVKDIVERKHLGRVVYAGGDDVLALLPVRDALQVADKLRKAFADTFDNLEEPMLDIEGEVISVHASTGLAYVHHTHNLQDAVQAAKGAQKLAKDSYDRNAVGVEFLRRSGEPRSMGHKWHMNGTSTLDHVNALTNAFGDGLSRNLPYDLTQIVYSMADASVPDGARKAELRRVLLRRLSEKKKDMVEPLLVDIFSLVKVNAPSEISKGWQNAQHWLELARFVAQKEGDV